MTLFIRRKKNFLGHFFVIKNSKDYDRPQFELDILGFEFSIYLTKFNIVFLQREDSDERV